MNTLTTVKGLVTLLALSVLFGCNPSRTTQYTDRIDPLLNNDFSKAQPDVFMPYGLIQLSPVNDWIDNNPGTFKLENNEQLAFEHFNKLRQQLVAHPDLRIEASIEDNTFQNEPTSLTQDRQLAAVGRYAALQSTPSGKEIRTEASASYYSSLIEFIIDSQSNATISLSVLGEDQKNSFTVSRPDSFYLRIAFDDDIYPLHILSRISMFPSDVTLGSDTIEIGSTLRSEISQPIKLHFSTSDRKKQILLNTAFSRIDSNQVIRNFETDSKGWWLDGVIQANKDAWKTHFSKFQLFGGSLKDQIRFYTYHYRLLQNLAFLTESAGHYPLRDNTRTYSKDLNEERFSWYGSVPTASDIVWLRSMEAVPTKRLGLDISQNLPLPTPNAFGELALLMEEIETDTLEAYLFQKERNTKKSESTELLALAGLAIHENGLMLTSITFDQVQLFMGGNAKYYRSLDDESNVTTIDYPSWFIQGYSNE